MRWKTVFGGTWVWVCLVGCEPLELSPEGQVTVAVSTDMEVPDELDAVSIAVFPAGKVGGAALYRKKYPLEGARQSTQLPLTVAFTARSGSAQGIHITVTGFLHGESRVTRDAETFIPADRQVLLRMPLGWLCADRGAENGAEGTPGACAAGTTCNQGDCVAWSVDPRTLGYFSEGQIHGVGAGSAETLQCFDVVSCFEGPTAYTPLVLASECVVALPMDGVESFNLAVVPAGREGFCGGRCYVPIDRSSTNGWSPLDQLPAAQLPPGVCQALQQGSIQGLVATLDCPTKTEGLPTCGEAVGAAETVELPANADPVALQDIPSVENTLPPECTGCLAGQCGWEVNACLSDTQGVCVSDVAALTSCIQSGGEPVVCLETAPPSPTTITYAECVSNTGCSVACLGISAEDVGLPSPETSGGGGGGGTEVPTDAIANDSGTGGGAPGQGSGGGPATTSGGAASLGEGGSSGTVPTDDDTALLERCPDTVCELRAGSASDLLIDSVTTSAEDARGTMIESIGNRSGSWYVNLDEHGTWTSSVATADATPLPSESEVGDRAMIVSGYGFDDWGAALGLHLSEQAGRACSYDASAYSGVEFWAMGNTQVFFRVETLATLPCDGHTEGLCPSTAECFNHFGVGLVLKDYWQHYAVTWDLLGQEAGWGIPVESGFDPATIVGLQWSVRDGGEEFLYGVDEVNFLSAE